MFKTQSQFTNSMFGSYAYDPIIERNQDHILIKINKLIDWSFVESEVADRYSSMGQNAIHPVRMFKLLIIQNLYNLSERELMTNTDCNIIYRYFVGLGLNEDVPHWTELGKFKERIGADAFERLFYRVLDEAERLGISISNKRNADATDIQANVDLKKCAKDKQDKNDKTYIDRNTTDKDAKFGKKESNGKGWYGYKSHTNDDAETKLITAVITTEANKTDESQLVPLIDKERDYRGEDAIRKQGGDKGYVGHTDELEERNILDYVIPRDNMKRAKEKKDKNKHYLHLKKLRYKVEQKFAEVKNRHGLGKARHRGKWRVHIHSLIIYLTVNLKRMVNFLIPKTA
ncbi:MAG: IS5 family transposase [Candidatus Falkowbacteria bacterium]